MNGTQQRTHRTATATLGARLNDLSVVFEQRDTHVLQRDLLLRQRLDALAAQIADLNVRFSELRDRTFWRRLTWLVTGR